MAKAKTKVSKKKATKKTPVKKKAAAKAVKKKVSKKKAPAKKTVTKKTTARKKAPAKKAPAKKAPAKKAPARKKAAAAKAPVRKKVAAKKKGRAKPAAKKVVAKKAVAKKTAVKKAPAKKAAAKKQTPKKTLSARSPSAQAAPEAPPKPRIIRKVVNLDEVKIADDFKPSDKEDYMCPQHLAYFKRKLENWRDELILESQETLEHLRTETRDVGDEAERASRESDNILELRTRDRYRKLLRKIEEALKRVEEGVYGYCEETGEEIGLGRLEARPIATLTVDAQERREMFQKQFRDDR